MNARFYSILVCLFLLLTHCQESDNLPRITVTKYPSNRKAALSITFDDGCPSVFTEIVPELDKYNLKATFYIIAGEVEKRNHWDKWKQLVKQGHEVDNHSLTHAYQLGTISDEDILAKEIDTSFYLMKTRMGYAPFSFGQPYHSTSYQADNMIFENHYATKISPPGFCKVLSLSDAVSFEQQMNEALIHGDWIVTTAHGVNDCFNPLTEEQFNALAYSFSKYRQSAIIETFDNLAKYKIESENVSITIVPVDNYYKVTVDSTLPEVFDYPLTIAISNIDVSGFRFERQDGTAIPVQQDVGVTLLKARPRTTFFMRPQ